MVTVEDGPVQGLGIAIRGTWLHLSNIQSRKLEQWWYIMPKKVHKKGGGIILVILQNNQF